MNLNALLPAAAVMILLVCSCKQKQEAAPINNPPETHYGDYSQLKVGNYWIYQIFNVDTSGKATALEQYDSCYISKDTIMNGNTYYYLKGEIRTFFGSELWLRDSLNYVVTGNGKIIFSADDFSTVFATEPFFLDQQRADTIAIVTQKMEDKDMLACTPAGCYSTSDFRTTYNMQPSPGLVVPQKVLHLKFGKFVGIVMQTLPSYLNEKNYTEMRLLRYHLN